MIFRQIRVVVMFVTVLFACGAMGLAVFRVINLATTGADTVEAARLVGTALRSARLYAMTNQTYVAVLVPTAKDDSHGGVNETQYKARAIRACTLVAAPEITGSGIVRGEFQQFLPGKEWIFLPGGAFFGDIGQQGGRTNPSPGYHTVNNVLFPNHHNGRQVDNIRAIFFTPDGRCLAATPFAIGSMSNVALCVHSGVPADNGTIQAVDDGSPGYEFRASPFTGEVQYVERHF